MKLIGKGAYGKVMLVKRSNQVYAMKIINKAKIKMNNLQRLIF